MHYIRKEASGQLVFAQSTDFLKIPSCLYGFCNENTSVGTSQSGRRVFCFEGTLDASEESPVCSCGEKNKTFLETTLIISKKPGNTGISRDIRTEFTTDLLLSD